MTRIRTPHGFHEEISESENLRICSDCGTEKSKLCRWCGKCYECHTGIEGTEESIH